MNRNPIPDLVELSVRVAESGDNQSEVKVELRVCPASIDGDHGLTFSVSLKRLVLSLDLDGFRALPGPRFGEPMRPNEVLREEAVSLEMTSENKASGEGGMTVSMLKPLQLAGKGAVASTAKVKETTAYTDKQYHQRVRALPNLMWEVTQPPWEDDILNLTYLADDAICKIAPQDRANYKSVQMLAYSKQKDISLEVTKSGINPFRSTNQKKLLNILISKALASEGQFNGTVTFSNSVIDFED